MREGFFGALAALVFGVAGAFAAPHADAGEGIAVRAAWARATPAGAPAGAAFLTLENPAAEGDALVAAAAPVADAVELHTHAMDGGVMKMRKVERIEIPAHGAVELKPGGLHVMLIGLRAPLAEGATFPLTLSFARGGTVEVPVTVRPIGARAADAPHAMPGHAMPGHGASGSP